MAKSDTKQPELVERVVRAAFVRYTVLNDVLGEVNDDGSPKQRPVVVTARQGETIQLLPAEAAKGDQYDAYYPDAAVTTTESGETVVEVDVREMSDADLAQWVKEDKPKADDVVNLAENDAALAERLLNAERTATNGRPRKSVNEKLTKVIDDAATAGTQVETTGTP